MKKRRKPIIFWRHLSVDVGRKNSWKRKKNVWSTIQKREEFVFPYITIMTFKKMIIPMNLTGNKKTTFFQNSRKCTFKKMVQTKYKWCWCKKNVNLQKFWHSNTSFISLEKHSSHPDNWIPLKRFKTLRKNRDKKVCHVKPKVLFTN